MKKRVPGAETCRDFSFGVGFTDGSKTVQKRVKNGSGRITEVLTWGTYISGQYGGIIKGERKVQTTNFEKEAGGHSQQISGRRFYMSGIEKCGQAWYTIDSLKKAPREE